MSFFVELKRRNVFRMGIAYVVVAWVLLQAIDFTLDIISAPNWVMQVFLIAGVAGLPVVLIIAWVFEMTPDGIKRESEIDRRQSTTQSTGRKLDRTIIVFLAVAVLLLLAERFIVPKSQSAPAPPVVKEETDNSNDTADNGKRSVAVLPFVNMSSDPEQEYFSDGLSEELLNRLAKNEQLHVAARTSSFQFKGQNQDVSEIGRQLKVDHVLEGSVRKSANRLRITVQLIKVDSGYHLWSETYEREMDDIFAIQDDIAMAITQALEVELGATGKKNTVQLTKNLEAYNLYLQGRYFLAERGGENMRKANELFAKAVALDEQFASAWSAMAFNSALLPSYDLALSASEYFEKTTNAARRAIELDPSNAEAYAAMGRIKSTYSFDWQGALQDFDHALKIDPNNVNVINLYGDLLALLGDFDSSIQFERKAISLDPLSAVHFSDLASVLIQLRQFEDAIISARRSMSLAPDVLDRRVQLVYALSQIGEFDEARSLIEQAETSASTQISVTEWWAFYHYQKNDVVELRKLIDEEIRKIENRVSTEGLMLNSSIAYYSMWLNGTQDALPWFEKSYLKREESLAWSDWFYLPEDISSDPEWLEFWNKPELKELHKIRRTRPNKNIGAWKERPGL